MSDDAMNMVLGALRSIEDRLGRIEDRLGQVEGRIGRVENRLEAVEIKVDRLVDDVSDLKLRLNAMETSFASWMPVVVGQAQRVDTLDARLLLVEKRLELRDRP